MHTTQEILSPQEMYAEGGTLVTLVIFKAVLVKLLEKFSQIEGKIAKIGRKIAIL
jgi:hypothetical protein